MQAGVVMPGWSQAAEALPSSRAFPPPSSTTSPSFSSPPPASACRQLVACCLRPASPSFCSPRAAPLLPPLAGRQRPAAAQGQVHACTPASGTSMAWEPHRTRRLSQPTRQAAAGQPQHPHPSLPRRAPTRPFTHLQRLWAHGQHFEQLGGEGPRVAHVVQPGTAGRRRQAGRARHHTAPGLAAS